MREQISQALEDEAEDLAHHAMQAISHAAHVGEGIERIRCLIEAAHSERLADRERLRELSMIAAGSTDGIALEDREPGSQNHAA